MNNDEEQGVGIPDALPQGTTIGQDYTILRVLGQGGFGITYLAHDEMMGGEVVIKESMPGDFAARDRDTLRLTPRLRQEENYTWARDRFLDEARLLHKLHHPNIVPVSRAFAALNTAYYVMPHVGATELGEAVRNHPEGKSEAYLAPLLRQLLDALTYLHGENLLHRDLKPSNILMSEKGVPIIIDFGSARATVSSRTHTMLESPGYTPIEQVQSHGNVGPWTDLYSLGATFYSLITGNVPPRSIDRHLDATIYSPLRERRELQQQYSRRFLAGIDKALEVRPMDRWQTAAEWGNELPAPQRAAQIKKEKAPTAPPAPPSTQNKQRMGFSTTITLPIRKLARYIVMSLHGQCLSATLSRKIRHDAGILSVAFSPDSKFLATGSSDKTARITEIDTGRTILEVKHDEAVIGTAFSSSNGDFLATRSLYGTARITKIDTGDIIRELKHIVIGWGSAFSPDVQYLATSISIGETANIVDVSTGTPIRKINHDKVERVAFSPQSYFLATVSCIGTARITEIATGRTILKIKHDDSVYSVTFSSDGKFLAIGCWGTARITEIATGTTISQSKHDGSVLSVAFSPDGRFLATGSDDKTARITEVATGRIIWKIKQADTVTSVAFSPDGKFLATGSEDGTARIYELKGTEE